jgi:hypothetical protein
MTDVEWDPLPSTATNADLARPEQPTCTDSCRRACQVCLSVAQSVLDHLQEQILREEIGPPTTDAVLASG